MRGDCCGNSDLDTNGPILGPAIYKINLLPARPSFTFLLVVADASSDPFDFFVVEEVDAALRVDSAEGGVDHLLPSAPAA